MKLKIYNRIFMVLMAIVLFGACKKDLGNYEYKELNSLVEAAGIGEEVVAIYGKDFVLKPDLKFTQDNGADESKYTYEWTYVGPNGLGGNKIFTLATTRNLDLKMNVIAGTYSAYYGVTDKASGVKYTVPFRLKVVNEINEGWIMMCDVNGKARADMLSLNSSGSFTLINDLLAATLSELKLEGKPVMTYTYNTGLLIGPDKISYGVYFGTDKFTTKVEPNTFKWTNTMSLNYEMFGVVPPGFYADVIKQNSTSSSYMIGSENAYYYERVQNIYYSAPINYITAEQKEFKVAPFIASNPNSSSVPATFYDKTNQRFVKHSSSAATCTVLPDPPATSKKFSFSTGMDLAYMQWVPFNGGEVFAILKGAGTTRYLARYNPTNNAQSYYDVITGVDFGNAEFYAVSPNLGYIFYVVGSKVYEYDMSLKSAKLMLDLGTKKISYFGFHEFKNTTKYPGNNSLMIGSYDPALPAGTEGSLNIYTVPTVNGDLVLDKSFSGFGRIKSLTYRER